jgi:hypothetical protein
VFSLSAAAVVVLSAGWVPGSPTGAPVAEAAVLESGGSGSNHGSQQGSGLRQGGGRQGGAQSLTVLPANSGPRLNHTVRHLNHIPYNFHLYHGPHFSYGWDWYFYRHISYPWLYQVFPFEPVGVCFTEYYFFEGAFYCFAG